MIRGRQNTGRPLKILMMADANYLAHVSRVLEIAKVLRDSGGVEVVIAGDGRFMKLPEAEGFPLDSVFTVPREKTLEYAKKAGLVSYSWWSDMITRSVESDLTCIRRNKPDLVVGDLRWSLSLSCRAMKVPYISITNAHWTQYFGCRIKGLDDHFTTNLFGRHMGGALLNQLKGVMLRYWALPFRALGKRLGVPEEGATNLYDFIEGDMTLLADIPEYGVTKDLPPRVRYVGPILWEANLPEPPWLETLDRDRSTLYFTMGSTGSSRFFDEAVRIFGDSGYQVLMTTGGLPQNITGPGEECRRTATSRSSPRDSPSWRRATWW